MTTRTSWPRARRALGSEPPTSPRPPVLAKGATSALRKRIFRGSGIQVNYKACWGVGVWANGRPLMTVVLKPVEGQVHPNCIVRIDKLRLAGDGGDIVGQGQPVDAVLENVQV